MKITSNKKPPIRGIIFDWERGLDPWHRDAFPDHLRDQAPNQSSNRETGWFGIDWAGNAIVFVPDKTEWT